uniref:Os08g0442700 protein n=1 Tax=Macrostomum lignano TaxID=282301 RepID=A0A1I8FL45_9PLAT
RENRRRSRAVWHRPAARAPGGSGGHVRSGSGGAAARPAVANSPRLANISPPPEPNRHRPAVVLRRCSNRCPSIPPPGCWVVATRTRAGRWCGAKPPWPGHLKPLE